MAFTESNMLPLGTKAPAFSLPDTVSRQVLSLNNLQSDVATVIMFLCNHCPYIGISSNDAVNYPQDSPENMKIHAATEGYTFPYLYDETQEVAKIYDAACTPDFYVFDSDMKLAYRGRIDGSRPRNEMPVTGEDLRTVLDTLLRGEKVSEKQYPSAGCNIKWKKNA
jgi:AhpC/TSA family